MKPAKYLRNRKIIFTIGAVLFVLLSAALFLSRFTYINKKYPNPQIVTHQIGETILGGDVSLLFSDYELYSGERFRKVLPDYQDSVMNEDMSQIKDSQKYVLVASVSIENKSTEEKTISLVQITAESVSWSNGIDGEIFALLNEGAKDPMNIHLQPGEKKDLLLPYSIYEFQFQERQWENIESRDYNLVLSYYPVRNIVSLD